MIELGYMAKRIATRPDWLDVPHIRKIVAVANCMSESFCDYTEFWKHNGFWFFDSPVVIRALASEHNVSLSDTSLVYYRGYERQWDAEHGEWKACNNDPDLPTNITPPDSPALLGYDVVTYSFQNAPECSPLSCNGIAAEMEVNEHCLINSLEDAIRQLETGAFDYSEPGPHRIIAMHAVDW